ncbi:MAG: hypothetical protein R2813_03420 [Flavobacteriales bacterium]
MNASAALSKYTLLFIVVFYALVLSSYGINYVLTWDVFGYYLYLPATFIYGDPFFNDLSWIQSVINEHKNTSTLYQIVKTNMGHTGKYPIGLSILYSPFFLIAHLVTKLMGGTADGFSAAYNVAINVATWTYSMASLVLLRKALLRMFSDAVVAWVLLAVFLGTNLFHQIIGAAGMPHVILFFLYSVALYFITMNQRSGVQNLLLGFTFGLMIIARPTDGLVLLLWAFWNYRGGSIFKYGIECLKDYHRWAYTVIALFSVISVQMLYWWKSAGTPVFYSYNNPGEGFDFLKPHLLDFMLSFRKGWLVYTPIMFCALIGMAFLKRTEHRFSLILYSTLYIYLVASWSCWWYASSFGNRGIVQAYALFAVPLGTLAAEVFRKKSGRAVLWMVSALFICLNVFQTWQLEHDLIHPSRMTKAAYKATLLQFKEPSNFKSLLMLDRDSLMVRDTHSYTTSAVMEVDCADELDEGREFLNVLIEPLNKLTSDELVWVDLKAEARMTADSASPARLIFSIEHDGEYARQSFDLDDIKRGESEDGWSEIQASYLTPYLRSPHDNLKVYFWQEDEGSSSFRNCRITIRERQNHVR